MKKIHKIVFIATVVALLSSAGAISYAAWRGDGATQTSVSGSTGFVNIVGNLRVATDDKVEVDEDVILMKKLYPIDHSGNGLKCWKFELSADSIGGSDIMFSVKGSLRKTDDTELDQSFAGLFWSVDQPERTPAENFDVNDRPSYMYVPDGGTTATIYVYMEAYSTSAMNARISLELGVRRVDELMVTVNDGNYFAVMEGETAVLPEPLVLSRDDGGEVHNVAFTAATSDTDISIINNNRVKVDKCGDNYKVTFTAVDSHIADRCGGAELNVVGARKLFADKQGSFTVTKEFAPSAEQVVECSEVGYIGKKFNIAPSMVYYAEATFNRKETAGKGEDYINTRGIGMGHFAASNENRILTSFVMNGHYNHKIKDYDLTRDIDTGMAFLETEPDTDIVYSWRLGLYRGLFDHEEVYSRGNVKYAVARVDDDFFAFVNDKYVACVSPEYYRNIDTVPGLFGLRLNDYEMTSIYYENGDNAEVKVGKLLKGGIGIVSAYVPDKWAIKSKGDGNFTVHEASEERDAYVSFNNSVSDFNDGMLSPYVYFDGDFTFEFDYKLNARTVNDPLTEYGMIIDLRNRLYHESIVRFGTETRIDNASTLQARYLSQPYALINYNEETGEKVYGFVYRYPFNDENGTLFENAWSSERYTAVNSYGVRFRVSRLIEGNGDQRKAFITYTAVTLDKDGNETSDIYKAVLEYSENTKSMYHPDRYNDAFGVLQIALHNQFVSGEYSNIRWTHSADHTVNVA